MKIVRYNGKTESYYRCTSPTMLIKGQLYEVRKTTDRGFQTDYCLQGIEGNFNSVWFDEVITEDPKPANKEEMSPQTFIAFSRIAPVVGESMRCYTFNVKENKLSYVPTTTSKVKEFERLDGGKVFKVKTQNNVYYVLVN